MFLNFKNLQQIYLIHKSVDFRKGVTGLNSLLYEHNYTEYNIGDVFIFFSKNKKSLKILCYSKTGFELWHKKLALEKYKIPANLDKNYLLNKTELKQLLSGYSILEKGFSEILPSKII